METTENTREDSEIHQEGISAESIEDETYIGEEDEVLKHRIRKARYKRTKIIRNKGKVWFLMICLSLDLIPRMLILLNEDLKESDRGYMEEMRKEWKKVQKEAGRKFVKLAKRREEQQPGVNIFHFAATSVSVQNENYS